MAQRLFMRRRGLFAPVFPADPMALRW